MLTEVCICGPNLSETEEEARTYQGKFVESNFHHEARRAYSQFAMGLAAVGSRAGIYESKHGPTSAFDATMVFSRRGAAPRDEPEPTLSGP